ncbi:hypothetical protein [Haloarchaeobius sp. HRN-SO-5]|uniref:hypothetical protein n=1 Tax=Haloarchaeobius sp. HRN-SO-5 TaxID=3446118 RepID=UPI003EBC9FF0
MGHVDKKPFAPWSDRDHPDADGDEDARWKWGITDNYVDGDTIAIAEDDHRLDGRAFIQRDDDPYAYVDGDDVRCPDTGEVHPAFIALLEHLGSTYADISQSGTGVHAIYKGDLPDGVKQASWQLDEDPWGGNDDLPSIEIYPGKRVCVMTGDHVPGTPEDVHEWNDDVIDPLLEANDEVATRNRNRAREDIPTARDDYDLDEYEPQATEAGETTTDIRDIFAALDRIDARHVADRTIVHRWNDSASTSDGERAFAPTWGPGANGTANIVNRDRWLDTGDHGGYGGPVVMAAIDLGDIRPDQAAGGVTGHTWWRGIDHLRDLGFPIPDLEDNDATHDADNDDDGPGLLEDAIDSVQDVNSSPVSTLPLAQLDALDPSERRRYAKKRGLEWPTTREARDQLFETITQVMAEGDDRVVDAPTSLGKSYTIATTAWDDPQYDAVTGGQPVVHLSKTRDARDEAIEAAHNAGLDPFVLRSRDEACPVARGDHDPEECRESDRQPVTMNGTPASEWISEMCEGKGLAFSAVHRHLEDHNDQDTTLPCCQGSSTTYDEDEGDFVEGESAVCPAIEQWDTFRTLRDSETSSELGTVIATHNFAHVPGLRMRSNVIIDEEPSFTADLSKERIERAVAAYLQDANAPVSTWEAFISLSRHDGWQTDAAHERERLQDTLNHEPDRDWYFNNPDAHTLAPALARAIFHAEDRGNNRRVGKTPYEPPRLDAGVRDDDGWNREWVTVVLDDTNTPVTVRTSPDFSQARSLVGLDAHPSQPVWSVNTVPYIQTRQVLDPEQRQLWRRYERGLRVVQVGDATRPLASGEYFNEDQARTLCEHLVDEYGGNRFRTGLTTKAVKDHLGQIMSDAGCQRPELISYGNEKSRNDFAHEDIGLVEGCIDPGDDYVLDLLAELDLDAKPETREVDGELERVHGRGFVGDDADTATEILASVRENHTAQAAGRYARNPDDPESTATVFVRTDAMPPGFADIHVPGIQWVFSQLQRDIVQALRDQPGTATARELADEVECSKEHVRTTLRRLAEEGTVSAFDDAGPHGATLYSDNGVPQQGLVDVQPTTNDHVLDSYTWALAISTPTVDETPGSAPTNGGDTTSTTTWDWQSAGDPGGGPP